MILLLCILLFLGTAAALWLAMEWERPVKIDRRDSTIRDLWEGLR